MHRWDRVVDSYMDWYGSRGLSPESVKHVRRELDRFGNWLKQRRPKPNLEQLGSDLIIAYIKDRNVFRARATLSGHISILRCFGQYLLDEGLWSSNPLRWIRGPKLDGRSHLPRRLSRDALQQLMAAAATSHMHYSRHLWVTVLCLLYGTGIRRGEMSRLGVKDWDGVRGLLRIDGRKTGHQRVVPVADLVYRGVESYLPQRQMVLESTGQLDEPSLLINQRGKPLSATAISGGIHRLARRAGVALKSLHQFRHSCASDLLEEGQSLPQVKAILGHQAVSTTVRYLHIADPQKHEAIKCHPLNDWLTSQEVCS